MIEVDKVSLILGKEQILEDISLEIDSGEICGIVGRNGSGKTMLMKCVCGFIKPTEGEIKISGKKIGNDVDFPDSIGIIIETPGFIPLYSGYKNLLQLAQLKHKIGKERVREVMNITGLDPDSGKRVGKYSLGMRQRLGIAQAIMENPDVLVLDEPFNGLDMEGVAEIRELLLRLKNEGKTIMIASHIAEDINILCDKVYQMQKGKIQAVSKN